MTGAQAKYLDMIVLRHVLHKDTHITSDTYIQKHLFSLDGLRKTFPTYYHDSYKFFCSHPVTWMAIVQLLAVGYCFLFLRTSHRIDSVAKISYCIWAVMWSFISLRHTLKNTLAEVPRYTFKVIGTPLVQIFRVSIQCSDMFCNIPLARQIVLWWL